MYRLILLAAAAALLAACAQKTPARGPSWRDTGTEIYSNAVLEMDGLKGDWQQVASFAETPGTSGCKPGKVRFGTPEGGAVPVQADLCLNGARQTYSGLAALPVPGRMMPAAAGSGSI
ncbi:MAG: lipocalin, partial [Gemmobacter sp.]|nr:lipocalin [Gemmobacter sp.]